MPATAAQIAANRKNSERSTGPKSAEGKEQSRANSRKTGLTGAGVVLPPDEALAVAQRAELLEAELRPSGELGRILVRRVALLSHRMERCGEQELAATAMRVRSAPGDFDEARARAIDDLFGRLEAEPAAVVRQLKGSLAGVDRLISDWLDLLADLEHPSDIVWDTSHWQRAEALSGRSAEAMPLSAITRWHLAYEGKPALLHPDETRGLNADSLRDWARDQIADEIAREVAALRDLRSTLDDGIVELDRAGAAARALFDPSREATLARKYEAAAERGMYRALRDLREHEAEVAATRFEPEVEAPGDGPRGTLGSFFPGREAAPARPASGPDHAQPEGPVAVTAGLARPAATGSPTRR